ncbi:hypothetical protein B6U80_00695 [Candidatus Pacearchaeota archaeon ex4484_26]|nr:MAG: hypothetical protein B6U80_00695 [Candidatus Pacearchaeota archaeon ex4484_26]
MKSKRKVISKKSLKSATSIRFCPICKSTNVVPYAGFISACYKCKNCGYVGNFFLEKIKRNPIKKNKKRNQKDLKAKNL